MFSARARRASFLKISAAFPFSWSSINSHLKLTFVAAKLPPSNVNAAFQEHLMAAEESADYL